MSGGGSVLCSHSLALIIPERSTPSRLSMCVMRMRVHCAFRMCVHSLVRSTYRRLLATLIRRAHRLAGTPRICPRRTVYSALQGVPVKIYPILRTHVIGHKTKSHGEIIPLPYTCGVPVETADSDEKSLLMFSFI